jgi:hypothetical protein
VCWGRLVKPPGRTGSFSETLPLTCGFSCDGIGGRFGQGQSWFKEQSIQGAVVLDDFKIEHPASEGAWLDESAPSVSIPPAAHRPQSRKQERAEIARVLKQRGKTIVEIAELFRARYRVNARVAFRYAHGWSQAAVATEWCRRWPEDPKTFKAPFPRGLPDA